MPNNVVLNIELSLVSDYDNATGVFIMHYKQFPHAVGTGKSEIEAERNLAFLCEDIWMKRQDESKEFLLKNYKDNISILPASC